MSKNVTPCPPGRSHSCSAASLETAPAAGECSNQAAVQGQTNMASFIKAVGGARSS